MSTTCVECVYRKIVDAFKPIDTFCAIETKREPES